MGDEDYNESNRVLPQTDLDLNLMLTDSVWGRPEVSKELKERLMKDYTKKNEDGTEYIDKASLWGLLGFYTRDMRLGNLSTFDNELLVCRYHIDLAHDFLISNMFEPFLISLSRSATILETSQSKGGFLRRGLNTLRKEEVHQQLEPPKKSLFGKNKGNEGGY